MTDDRQIHALAQAIIRDMTWRENMAKLREGKQRRRRARKHNSEAVPALAEKPKTAQVSTYPSAEDYTA